MSLRLSAVRLLLLLAILPLATKAKSQAPVDSLDDIIAATAKNQEVLRSAQAEGVNRVQYGPDYRRMRSISPNAKVEAPETAFNWAFKGEKRYYRYVLEGQKVKPANVRYRLIDITKTEIYDGTQQFNLFTSRYEGWPEVELRGNIERKRSPKPSPLSFGYMVETRWAADVLREGSFKLGESTRDAKWGLLQEVSEEKSVSYGTEMTRLWLAPQYGYLVVRGQKEWDLANEGEKNHSLMEFSLDRLEKRDAVWFPVQGTISHYEFENGEKKLLLTRTMIVNKFTVNSTSDSLFTINFLPGTGIVDSDTKEYFRIGLNGERIPIDLTGKAQNGSRVMGWLFMVSLSTLLFLCMGVLWRRQQNQRKVAS